MKNFGFPHGYLLHTYTKAYRHLFSLLEMKYKTVLCAYKRINSDFRCLLPKRPDRERFKGTGSLC